MRSILSTFTLLVPGDGRRPCDPKTEQKPTVVPDVIYGRKDGMTLTFDVIRPAKPNGAGILFSERRVVLAWTDPQVWLLAGKRFPDKGFTLFIVRHAARRSTRSRKPSRTSGAAFASFAGRRRTSGSIHERLGVTGGGDGGTCR